MSHQYDYHYKYNQPFSFYTVCYCNQGDYMEREYMEVDELERDLKFAEDTYGMEIINIQYEVMT